MKKPHDGWEGIGEKNDKPMPQPLRCWDGVFGCEQHKPPNDFRFHPLLCLSCVEGLCLHYSVPRGDIELLTALLSMDAGLYRTARYFKAPAEKISALNAGRDRYIPQLLNAIKAMRNRHEIEAKGKAFRDWWFAQAEIEFPKEAEHNASAGMATISESLK